MIDWQRVQQLQSEVGAEELDEVVEIFLEEVDTVLARMVNMPTPETLEQDLHFLKGSAMSLGFRKLSNLCRDGESASRKNLADTVSLTEISECYEASKQVFLEQLPTQLAS